ncbi:MAG TPA: HlyD family efflux transporter periplasmic adaptor subunit [Candidatus Aminicenantes bacterium]|nr:HlyD family efflux transporter periplasmic adaptor subunit [Candidatus Aminicenantes bacterium]
MKRWVFIMGVFGLLLAACSDDGGRALRAAGVVDGDVLNLRSKVSGRLEKMDVSEGEAVTAGRILAQIDARNVLNRIEAEGIRRRDIAVQRLRLKRRRVQLEAARDYAVNTSRRLARLREKAAVSGDQYEQARLKRIETETALSDNGKQLLSLDLQEEAGRNREELLRLSLEDHTLTAPIDGVVLEIHSVCGENLFPGNAVLEILDTSSLFVEVFLEEAELGKLKLNQDALIRVDGREEPVTGRVAYFGRKAEFSPKYILSEQERRNLLVQVKVEIPAAAADAVKLGMPVTVEFPR